METIETAPEWRAAAELEKTLGVEKERANLFEANRKLERLIGKQAAEADVRMDEIEAMIAETGCIDDETALEIAELDKKLAEDSVRLVPSDQSTLIPR